MGKATMHGKPIKNKKKSDKIFVPFESIEFSPHEWGTVLLMFTFGLYDLLHGKPKRSRFKMDFRISRINRKGKAIKNYAGSKD